MNNKEIWQRDDIDWDEKQRLHKLRIEETLKEQQSKKNETIDVPILSENEIKIYNLQRKLDGDYRYKKRIDGEYTDEEWAVIAEERRAWREELRGLKEEKELEEKENENAEEQIQQEMPEF